MIWNVLQIVVDPNKKGLTQYKQKVTLHSLYLAGG